MKKIKFLFVCLASIAFCCGVFAQDNPTSPGTDAIPLHATRLKNIPPPDASVSVPPDVQPSSATVQVHLSAVKDVEGQKYPSVDPNIKADDLNPPIIPTPPGRESATIVEIANRQQELEQSLSELQNLIKTNPALSAVNKDLVAIRDYCDNLAKAVNTLSHEMKEMRKGVAAEEESQFVKTQNQIKDLSGRLDVAQNKPDNSQQITDMQAKVDGLATALKEAKDHSIAADQVSGLQKKLDDLSVALKETRARAASAEQLADTQKKVQVLTESLNASNNAQATRDAQLHGFADRLSNLETALASKDQIIVSLKKENGDLKVRVDSIQSTAEEAADLAKRSQEACTTLIASVKSISAGQDKVVQLDAKYADIDKALASMSDMSKYMNQTYKAYVHLVNEVNEIHKSIRTTEPGNSIESAPAR